MRLTDEQIGNWSGAPSETEDARCTNAVSQVTQALRGKFGNSLNLIRQGSYTNRTNIRVDSDVDLAAVHTGYYYPDTTFLSPVDKTRHDAGFVVSEYSFAQYKSDVETTLRSVFGTAMVERKNKCIRVAGNTNRTPIDVVPAFEHHRYASYGVVSVKGIEFAPDNGQHRVNSFPEQHYTNGVSKNTRTSRNFKAMVRILKRSRQRLIEEKVIGADTMPSFFLECLVWNVPDTTFNGSTWRTLAAAVTSKIWNDMRNPEIAKTYAEVSDLKWLFSGQRTYAQAEEFMLHAWRLLTQ